MSDLSKVSDRLTRFASSTLDQLIFLLFTCFNCAFYYFSLPQHIEKTLQTNGWNSPSIENIEQRILWKFYNSFTNRSLTKKSNAIIALSLLAAYPSIMV